MICYKKLGAKALWREQKGTNLMKKRMSILLLALTAVLAAALMAGCGDNNGTGTADGTELTDTGDTIVSESGKFDIKGSDYVTLCDYSAIDVTLTGDYTVDDEDVLQYFEQIFENFGPFYTADPDKTVVEEGDIVNVDYVGKRDGVAFDRGSAENQNIDVYNNCDAAQTSGFIAGFTDGLKGASVGDVIDWDVTFPEDYGNAELAGQPAVFTFTVNSIQKVMDIDDVDDAFAQEQFGVDTVEEMYEQIRSYLEQVADENRYMELYDATREYLIANCTVDIPQDYVEARITDYRGQFVRSYCDGDETMLADYVSQNFGISLEEMEESWRESMTEGIQWELIMSAIAEKEGTELVEEEFEAFVDAMVSSEGYGTRETMYGLYGYGDVAYGEKYVRQLYTYNQALETVMENANVQENAAEDAGDTDGTEGTETVNDTEK